MKRFIYQTIILVVELINIIINSSRLIVRKRTSVFLCSREPVKCHVSEIYPPATCHFSLLLVELKVVLELLAPCARVCS